MALAPAAVANHSVTDLLSIGPDGGNANVEATFQGASKDATHVFFRTDESLVAADTDFSFDIYERFGTTTTLKSIGSQPGVDLDASFVAASSDGSRVFFSTRDQLVSQDIDAGLDFYERSAGVTTLFPSTSAATAATGAVDYQLYPQGSSQNGSRTFFTTAQQLTPADMDGVKDVYVRQSDGTISLVSTGPDGGNGPTPANFDGASTDASHAFFHTNESLLTADTDVYTDIYDRAGISTTLVSTAPGTGNGPYDAAFGGSSQDGSYVFFTTLESLIAFPDSDGGYQDVYERSGGSTKLVSYGPNSFDGPYYAYFGGNSADGTRAWFQTNEQLVSADTDGQQDVYERSSNSTKIVSTGGGAVQEGQPASYAGASQDGARVWFQGYVCDNFCTYYTVFERFGGTTVRVSPCCNAHWGFRAGSADGSRVFVEIGQDTWERFNGVVTQIQTTGQFQIASLDGTRIIFHHPSQLVGADTDSSQDVYAALVAGAPTGTPYPRPNGASPIRVPLVPQFKPCETSNSQHGGTLPVTASCKDPELVSSTVTLGNSTDGFARLGQARVIGCDTTSSPGCAAIGSTPDVRLFGNGSDIVCKAGAPPAACPGGAGSDYDPNTAAGPYTAGLDLGTNSNTTPPTPICNPSSPNPPACAVGADMTATAGSPNSTSPNGKTIRITDSFNNNPSAADPAGCASTTSCSGTVRDQAFPVPVVCQATASTAIGSYCGVNTTANALVPGVVVPGKGAVIGIGQVQVFDSGPDGVRSSADDELLAIQGLYVP